MRTDEKKNMCRRCASQPTCCYLAAAGFSKPAPEDVIFGLDPGAPMKRCFYVYASYDKDAGRNFRDRQKAENIARRLIEVYGGEMSTLTWDAQTSLAIGSVEVKTCDSEFVIFFTDP